MSALVTQKIHNWDVDVQDSMGQVTTERVNANWEPTHDLTPDAVADAACWQARVNAGRPKGVQYAAVKVEYNGRSTG